MKTKLITLLIAAIALSATAQDKALLETLVKKGTLTQEEAADIAKQSVVVTPGSKETKSIKIKGGISAWYGWNQGDMQTSPRGTGKLPQTNGFELRYVKLGLEADLGMGWSADIMTDFGMEGSDRDYLDRVVISKKVALDYLIGQLDIGLSKVNFGQEQNMDDFGQLAIERSVATFFFTRPDTYATGVPGGKGKNFGSRALGVFWNGTLLQIEGLYYGVAAVGGNSFEDGYSALSNEQGNNNLSFYLNAGYKNSVTIKNQTVFYDVGVNYGYSSGGYEWLVAATNSYENRSIWGLNPYAAIKWEGLTLLGEFFIQSIEDGKDTLTAPKTSTPLGVNATVAYKFDIGEWGKIEPVLRFSWLTSDGYGIVGAGNGQSFAQRSPLGVPYAFNNAKQVYLGANWYVIPAVKVSAGYEWAQFSDNANTPDEAYRATSSTIRAQLQILF